MHLASECRKRYRRVFNYKPELTHQRQPKYLQISRARHNTFRSFILREKITHFDHKGIMERIVQSRGAGAHEFFLVYESMEKFTKPKFLCNQKRRCKYKL